MEPYRAECQLEQLQKWIENLTSLLSSVVRACGERILKIAYVTDAGMIETAYWKTTLRKFYVDGQRIKIDRTVDYYHARLRLTAIADSLKLDEKARQDWLENAQLANRS